MKIFVNHPVKVKLLTVGLGALAMGASAIPALAPFAELLRMLSALLVGGGAVSVVRKP